MRKAHSGRLHEARRCISCAECSGYLNVEEPAYRVARDCDVTLRTSVESIGERHVTAWDSVSGLRYDIPATRVLIASRMESVRSLADTPRVRL